MYLPMYVCEYFVIGRPHSKGDALLLVRQYVKVYTNPHHTPTPTQRHPPHTHMYMHVYTHTPTPTQRHPPPHTHMYMHVYTHTTTHTQMYNMLCGCAVIISEILISHPQCSLTPGGISVHVHPTFLSPGAIWSESEKCHWGGICQKGHPWS